MIIHNRAKCLKCGTIIESKHRHDFVWCRCKTIAVDGGKEYLRRVGVYQYFEEMSELTDEITKGVDLETLVDLKSLIG